MYSNDMWEFHPESPERFREFPLQFWENGKVKIDRVTPEHQPMLTTWYTEHAVDFIHRNKDQAVPAVRPALHAARSAVSQSRSSRASPARAFMAT